MYSTADTLPELFVFSKQDSPAWRELRDRVIEHNIRVLAKYYTQITVSRLSQLLDLSVADAEERISQQVVKKDVYARIDRPAGIVTFGKRSDANDVLNEWASRLEKHVKLVDDTVHLIHRENVAHKIGQPAK